MPWFEYEGQTPGGTAIAGRIEARDREAALDELGQMLIEVRELRADAGPPTRAAGLSENDFLFFNEQLASLSQAGIALDEGLALLARDIESPRLRRWIEEIVEDLRRGIPVDQAIARREAGLPVLYSRVVRAGIETSQLPTTLLNLNQHLRLAGTTRRMMWETATYPLMVALFALAITSVFFLFIVPQFRPLYEEFGDARLPAVTLFMLELSRVFPILLLVTGIVVAAGVLGWRLLCMTPRGRHLRERILLGIPMIGHIHRISVVARFVRAVAAAVGTGLPLPQALRLASGATGSTILTCEAEYLATEVERGQSPMIAARATQLIPPLFGFCAQIAVGRDGLPAAMHQLASAYESRAIYAQSMLRAILFPVLVLIIGAGLGFCIGAMFVPVISLIEHITI